MEPIRRTVKNYLTASGKNPFRQWLGGIDGSVRGRIVSRLRRIEEHGNYGDCEPVGDAVFELRFDLGPGYRVYFGIDGDDVILLRGGNKSTQESDIRNAKDCWRDYNA